MQAKQSKLKALRIRAISTVVLIGSFVAVIYLGHVPLMAMIFGIQVRMKLAVKYQFSCLPRESDEFQLLARYHVECEPICLVGAVFDGQGAVQAGVTSPAAATGKAAAGKAAGCREHLSAVVFLLCSSILVVHPVRHWP